MEKVPNINLKRPHLSAKIVFVKYTEEFLSLSWTWLNDPEIKALTMTANFSREDQLNFFNQLPFRSDYKIFGIMVNDEKSGACGMKNISNGEAELWCYLGLKKYWGMGLSNFIIQKIERESKKLKISKLYLKVTKLNLRAIKAYEKNGFRVDSQFSETIQMSKQI
jgi:RimJ/RimL family protein N-acetyltransferase